VIPVGFTLQPEVQFLDACGPLLGAVDYLEIAPETTWRWRSDDTLEPNGYHHRFRQLAQRRQFFVAHGVGLSLGTDAPSDRARRRRWLARVREDHARFRFRWYTDHLGASSLAGQALTLPLPLPMTAEAARVVRRRLGEMRRAVGVPVGVENSVCYFTVGDPREEPRFLNAITRRHHLLLDLHNVYTMALNFGFDMDEYVAQLDLTRVIELHVSGGSESDPAWLPSGRVLRLDGHDGAVPEPVWQLLARVLPRCPRLRGVTLERMEGTVGDGDVPLLAGELMRLKALVQSRRRRA
jgi:uncharacterized protein (UPF0276 family)